MAKRGAPSVFFFIFPSSAVSTDSCHPHYPSINVSFQLKSFRQGKNAALLSFAEKELQATRNSEGGMLITANKQSCDYP